MINVIVITGKGMIYYSNRIHRRCSIATAFIVAGVVARAAWIPLGIGLVAIGGIVLVVAIVRELR
jgi:hypothetical protein